MKAGYDAERVKDGRFQAMMEVALVNDGPVRGSFVCPCDDDLVQMQLTLEQVTLELQAGSQNNDKSE